MTESWLLLYDALPAFTAADLSCCLFWVFLPLVLSSASEMQCSISLRSWDWLGLFRIIQNNAGQSTLLHLTESGQRVYPLYTSELIRLFLSSVTSINKNPVPLEAMHAHAITPCFTDDVVCFELWAVPSLRHTFILPVILVQVDLNFSVQRMLLQTGSGFCKV